MKDTDLMPWGKFKGKRLIDVPAHYLLWLIENNKCSGEVKKYIEDNIDTIKIQARMDYFNGK
jgi:uncharacterized protein (DUF3820 family)